MSTVTYAARDSRTMLRAQPTADGALPVPDSVPDRGSDHLPAAVRLRLWRDPRRRARWPIGRSGRLRELCRAWDHRDHGGRRGPRDGDLRRHGHVRRHHCPVPHHGDLPDGSAHRSCRRQPDPDNGQHGGNHCSGAAGRVPAQCHTRGMAGGHRTSGVVLPGTHLAGCRARAECKERRDRKQRAHDPVAAAVTGQRVRASPTRCRPRCAGSPSTSRSPRSSRPYEVCCWARRSASTAFSLSGGVLASGWPATCGRGTCSTGHPVR